MLLHGVKPRLSDHPEGGPAVCGSDSGTRRRVRSIWPSGGAHLPEGTGLKRRRRARGRTKGGRTRTDRYTECLHGCPSMPVHSPARMHARTFSRTHERVHASPSVIHNTVNPTHTPSVRRQSPSEIKPALRACRRTNACEYVRGETRRVAWLRDRDRRTDTVGSMDSRRLICGWRMTRGGKNENRSRIDA